MSETAIFNVVVGTAGHIDHGKSSMVQHLTGVDPDRLPEEKNRGLTIDLGFAPLTLQNGLRIGLVDVPGHERLIKNMVAGATGIDLVLLVVAADDSVMPQTREHLTIMQILGLEHGIVVVSKIDLIEEEMLELVRDDISESLKGTFLENAPMCEISSQTGEGFDKLIETLHSEIEKVEPREESGLFRMPVQRVFSPKGFGTVVTGIPISGNVGLGDTLEISPLGQKGRVRGIQAYKETTDRARAGHSTAINISDIDYREVHRGMVVSEPGYLTGAKMFEARLRYLPDNHRPLLHQTEIRLHVGTAEVLGKVFLLEGKKLDPGEEAFVQFRLVEPIVALPGDRYVLRLHSPMWTIGGGEILDRSTHRLKSGKGYVVDSLRSKQEVVGDSEGSLLHHLASAPAGTLNEKDLSLQSGLPLGETRELVQKLVEDGKIVPASRSGLLIAKDRLESGRDDVRNAAENFFQKHPRRLLFDKSQLRQRLDCHDVFLEDLLAKLVESGDVESVEAGRVRFRDFGPRLSRDDEAALEEIGTRLRDGKFGPPTPPEIASERGWNESDTIELYDLLDERGDAQKVSDGIYFHADAMEEARGLLRSYLEENGEMTAAEAKNVLGSTRKYMIPLLEQLDREGFTARRGDARVLARN